MSRLPRAVGYAILAVWLLSGGQHRGDFSAALAQVARPQVEPRGPSQTLGIVFSVRGGTDGTSDQALTYPDTFYWIPDEHTTVMPAAPAGNTLPQPGRSGPHNFFVAMGNCVGLTAPPQRSQCLSGKGAHIYNGTFVLRSSDFNNFSLAPGFGNTDHGQAIFWPPRDPGNCGYRGATHFDEQYAAPGSVLQDPTLPPGNLIMIYEAEIHCPQAPQGMAAGWVSVGVARSSDGGRTWPPPVPHRGMENDWLEYGDGRYAGITLPGAPPKQVYTNFYGDSLPSAFIDDRDPSGDYYIYVAYQFTGAPPEPGKPNGTPGDWSIHVARAWLGNRDGRRETGRLHFHKWYQGGWNAEGRGGLENGVMQPCNSGLQYTWAPAEGTPQIEYSDALGRYMMTFVCSNYRCPPSQNGCYVFEDSLYYSTASSLEKQDWTTPQLIQNSTYPHQSANPGWIMDGGYPSFFSPGCDPGHLGLTGYVFLLKGNPLADRQFVSRQFTIQLPVMGVRHEGELANGCRPHGAEGTRPRSRD